MCYISSQHLLKHVNSYTIVNIYLYLDELHFIELSNTNLYTFRTHTCGQLRAENSEESVILCGWLEYKRLNRFIILRDGYGSTQLIIPENASFITVVFT